MHDGVSRSYSTLSIPEMSSKSRVEKGGSHSRIIFGCSKPHQFLLHTHGSSRVVHPRTVAAPESEPANPVTESSVPSRLRITELIESRNPIMASEHVKKLLFAPLPEGTDDCENRKFVSGSKLACW